MTLKRRHATVLCRLQSSTDRRLALSMDLHEILGQIGRSAVWLPDWAIAGAAFIVAAILALLVHGAIMRVVHAGSCRRASSTAARWSIARTR